MSIDGETTAHITIGLGRWETRLIYTICDRIKVANKKGERYDVSDSSVDRGNEESVIGGW